jgi:hypothetical protein
MARFHLGKVPADPEFDPDAQGWTSLNEPNPWLAQLISLPVIGLALVLLAILWLAATPIRFSDLNIGFLDVLYIFVIIAPHELIHLVCHPHYGATSKSILGFWPATQLFYAHYDGVMSKQRFLVILAAPLIVLSVLPLVLCAALQFKSLVMLKISLFNCLCGAVDLLGIIVIWWQVPSQAVTRNKGWRTYYRIPL